MRDQILTILLIQMDQALGIGRRRELMATLSKIVSQLPVVVNLPVEDHPYRAIFIVDRLLPGMHVDDRQPSHAQSHAISKVKPIVIRTSPPNERTHPPDQRLINVPWLCMNGSDNATHEQYLSDSHAEKKWQLGTFAPSAADRTPAFQATRS
jgi:hypothetical protein